jgi:hypothetical protein
LVASVSEPAGKSLPSINGQVVFMDGTQELGTVSLVSGAATLDAPLTPGWHLLIAYFPGNETYAASVSTGTDVHSWILLYLPTIQR